MCCKIPRSNHSPTSQFYQSQFQFDAFWAVIYRGWAAASAHCSRPGIVIYAVLSFLIIHKANLMFLYIVYIRFGARPAIVYLANRLADCHATNPRGDNMLLWIEHDARRRFGNIPKMYSSAMLLDFYGMRLMPYTFPYPLSLCVSFLVPTLCGWTYYN